ncbi:hypothetical protein LSH36_2294g00004 [Paralvinella palmiformis]|uniref:Uncharacterized protein n=1 Tax=Paralvinella palmiformis TaxID=53620 RepID=A0AAD9IR69_9ANNE|nr:hypothetical protein LSH36_2294g00004 [Paralvinella palmiformis]
MRLKDGAVPSKFCWTEKEKSANVDRQLRAERRQLQHDIIVDQDVDMVDESVIVIDSSIEMLHVEEVETVAKATTTQGVQTNAGPILLESSSQTGSDPLPNDLHSIVSGWLLTSKKDRSMTSERYAITPLALTSLLTRRQ